MKEHPAEKTAVVVWEKYLEICKQGFVLDEEADWTMLEEVLAKIKELDPKTKMYACTYPIEITDSEMYMYCDNLWLKTKLRKNQIAKIFSEYREIEPCDISELTDDDKDSVDIYMTDKTQYCDFADVSNEFKNRSVISIYWD